MTAPREGDRASARQALAAARRAMREFIDRVLQPGRHRRALALLRTMPGPRAIIVVCYGNVCRSPYLEVRLRRELPAANLRHVHVSSAGFVGPGRPSPELARECARARGLDLDLHRSRLLSADLMALVDLVIVMDAFQLHQVRRAYPRSSARLLVAGDLDPMPGVPRAIPDPWGKALPAFEASYDRLDRCAQLLVQALGNGR